ncbi:hypothetical protein ACHRVZ_21420, partial [Flavobacterium sp. FlaQc-57]|uniref:hypothetical protein n=1 Tax=Flavobacterium sp. FlaQc-57 TaxID=3374186 RepID=UPI003757623A
VKAAVNSICLRTYLLFVFRLSLKAGAKVENLFLNGKCFLKFFKKKISSLFTPKPYQSINELPLFCGVQM